MHRSVESHLRDHTCVRAVCKGGPQGGVTTPVLWNMVIDELLTDDPSDPVHKVCYADDVTAIVAGPCIATLRDLAQSFINKAAAWADRCGLRLSETKTVAMVFTSKRSRLMKPILLYGKPIAIVSRIKCLGVTLDQQLSWAPHVQEKARKALALLAQLRRAFGSTWGLSPGRLWWIYTTMIRPAISYASLVWRSALEVNACKELLRTVQGTRLPGHYRRVPLYLFRQPQRSPLPPPSGCVSQRGGGHLRQQAHGLRRPHAEIPSLLQAQAPPARRSLPSRS